MKQQSNWYVITGGPSSGKTTLAGELAKLGYKTYPEAVRILIDRELAKGRELEEIQGTIKLQKDILAIQLENEKNAPKDEFVFFDRAIPDGLAYTRFNGLKEDIFKGVEFRGRYRKIFFCQQLPFIKDYARIEDSECAKRLSQTIHQTYSDLSYEIIDLKAEPTPANRIKTIIRELGLDGTNS